MRSSQSSVARYPSHVLRKTELLSSGDTYPAVDRNEDVREDCQSFIMRTSDVAQCCSAHEDEQKWQGRGKQPAPAFLINQPVSRKGKEEVDKANAPAHHEWAHKIAGVDVLAQDSARCREDCR